MIEILTDVQKGTKSPEVAQTELLDLFGVMLSDLPETFYDKFVERQEKECNAGTLGLNNSDKQYYFARGFLATVEIIKECYH